MRPHPAPTHNPAGLGCPARVTKAKLMKYLIVDDDERIRRMIKTIVADDAAVFCECGDGAAARTAYAEHRPDWVLMDIKMAGVDGITATRQITSSFPGARVMVVSDYDDRGLRDAAREAGACEYVAKENLHDLCRILRARAGGASTELEKVAE